MDRTGKEKITDGKMRSSAGVPHILLYLIMVSVAANLLSGCASRGPIIEQKKTRRPSGSYYVVKRGDTLWRIAQLYEVSVQDIIKANRLPDAARIDVGQKLFIPSGPQYAKRIDAPDSSGKFSWPVAGRVISYFGNKKGNVTNKGIDIEARKGSKVVAAMKGVVSFINENMKGLGKTLIIDHENGFSTVYAHNEEILVSVGERVERNQVIAKVGETGRTTKPHLHFQIRKGHKPQNPFYYLP